MDKDKMNYLDKQLTYIEAMGKDVDKADFFDLLPMDWHENENYKLKGEILDEAIKKHCLIVDTNLYSTMQEDVIDLKI